MNKLCCIMDPDMKCTACNGNWCSACINTLEYQEHWGPPGVRGGEPIFCMNTNIQLKWNGLHSHPVTWVPTNE